MAMLSQCNLCAQTHNTMGTDFWLTFMYNVDTTPHSQTLSVFATSFRTCTATVSNPITGWSRSFVVDPAQINRLYVPTSQAYTTSSGSVTNTGLHVTATDTISLYTITQGYPNLDYANVMPTSMLLSDYMVQSYPADRYSSEFAIVAAEDSVNVSITLRGNTIDGHTSGQTYSVLIPRAGQVLQVQSTRPGDLSGTRISAANNKRIAVFNGDVCVYIPNQNVGQSCDHVVEQALPTSYWGRNFIVAGSHSGRTDYVRITALNNNCQVKVNGNVVATLNSSFTYQYQMTHNNSIDYIETSEPAMVYIYFPSMNGAGSGDPSMTTIIPIEQCLSSIRFPTISTTNVTAHCINIICDTSTVSHIYLDGTNISSRFQPIANAPGYSYMRSMLNTGTHTLYDQGGNGFITYMYGSGNRVSYGYTLGYAGRNLREPKGTLLVRQQDAAEHPEGFNACIGQAIPFQINSDGVVLSVQWSFGDGDTSTLNPKYHAYDSLGDYEACAIFTHKVSAADTVVFCDTLCTTIHVYPTYWSERFDTCLQSNLPIFYHGDPIYTEVLGDTNRYTSRYGCDSVEVYHLHIWENDTTWFDTTVCDTLLPFTWRGIVFPYDSSVVQRYVNRHGADSLVYLLFYTIHCTNPYEPPEPPVDSAVLWIPNTFTPSLSINKEFRFFSHDIIEATVSIYHRWGGLITQFDGLTQSWDGTLPNGTPCPQAAYVYRVVYRTRSASSEQHVVSGTVTLLR